MAETETVETCAGCGATVYPEHLVSRKAERVGGQILCVHCVRERSGTADGEGPAPPGNSGGSNDTAVRRDAGGAASAPSSIPEALPPARSVEEADAPPPKKPQISFERGHAARKSAFRRPLAAQGPHATRCRVFHCRLNEPAVRTMEDQINEWIDADDALTVKFMTSSVGPFDTKSQEPHLIVTLFY